MTNHNVVVRNASDGYPLHARHWPAIDTCQGWVVLLHGIQSHSGWYLHSCEQFARGGFDVRCVDRRGSGMNTQQRGHAVHWQRLFNDVVHVLNDVNVERREKNSTAPIILVGISWGGKLAKVIAQSRTELIDALALITPGIFAKVRPTFLQQQRMHLGKMLGILERPVPIPLENPALFTSQTEAQQFIRNDPDALHTVTSGFLFASHDLDRLAQQRVQLQCPLLLMLAERDQIIDNQKTRDFFKQCVPRKNMSICYKAVEHTLEFEPCRDQFIHDFTRWMHHQRQRRLKDYLS